AQSFALAARSLLADLDRTRRARRRPALRAEALQRGAEAKHGAAHREPRRARGGPVAFHKDASLYTGLLDPGGAITMPIAPGRRAWVQVVRGEATVNGETLAAGDGAAIQSEATLELRGRTEPSEVLVFDLG